MILPKSIRDEMVIDAKHRMVILRDTISGLPDGSEYRKELELKLIAEQEGIDFWNFESAGVGPQAV